MHCPPTCEKCRSALGVSEGSKRSSTQVFFFLVFLMCFNSQFTSHYYPEAFFSLAITIPVVGLGKHHSENCQQIKREGHWANTNQPVSGWDRGDASMACTAITRGGLTQSPSQRYPESLALLALWGNFVPCTHAMRYALFLSVSCYSSDC